MSRKAIEKFAAKAPHAELHVGHFEPFHVDNPAVIAADQADWLRRQGL